jgi:hypothetical protein
MNTLTPLAYTCNFCQKGGVAYYAATCGHLRLEAWKAMLCCNRCADYYSKRQAICDSIWQTTYTLSVFLDSPNKDSSVKQEAMRRGREKLTIKTKAFAELVCSFYRKMTIWEPDFVQLLVEQPAKCHQLLNDYERGVRPI